MGAGISQEQLEQHLVRQEMLLKQLQAVVDRQTQSLRAMGQDDHSCPAADERHAENTGVDAISDELTGLHRAAKASEKKKPDVPVDTVDVASKPSIEWKEPTEEDERNFMATKPWLGAMAQPDGFQFGKTDGLPDVKLELEHVHGYTAKSSRMNLAWGPNADTIVYPAAGVGILQSIRTKKQKYCRSHTDDIVCLAYHAGRQIVATGEMGKTPALILWDANTGAALAVLKGFHKRAVISVSFSADGSKVASVGLDDEHSVAVYDWSAGALLGTSKGDTNRILSIDTNLTRDANPNVNFVTVGVKHIYFWALSANNGSGEIKKERGLLGKLGEQKALLAAAFTTIYTCVGTADGEMYLFEGIQLKKVVDAHQGPIFAMKAVGDTLYTGGKDGFLSMWNMNNQKKTMSVNLNKYEKPEVMATMTNSVRAIDVDKKGVLLVGTSTSSIYTVNMNDGAVSTVMSAHFAPSDEGGELWGCASSPTDNLYATAGEDSTLRIWDIEGRTEKARLALKGKGQSVAWSPKGDTIAVGLTNGTVQIVMYTRSGTLEDSLSIKKKAKRVQCLAFSPDGKSLAAGTADNVILLFDCEKDFKMVGTCKGNNSVILHVDYSADSKYIQSCSQSYELLFYMAGDQEQVTKSRDLRNQAWATLSSTLGWDVQGIWPAESDGSDVNGVNKSSSNKYLATAEDSGLVKLFNYPCVGGGLDKQGALVRRPMSQNNAGHSSHVTNVVWTLNDKYVVSTGGADLSVFQWKVVKA